MAERGVVFDNVFNFRDLGGYTGVDGRTVRWQRLFRSDDLSRIDEHDQKHLSALGIRTVVDLRRPNEVAEGGRIPEFDGYLYRHVHLAHPLWPKATFVDTAARVTYVVERYLEMTEAAAEGIGETLQLIADRDAAPLVFHCIAGKDRTGVVSALTLSLLGVSDEDIADDYELSEAAEEANWKWYTRAYPDLAVRRWTHITVSPRQGILDFLNQLRARHGSVEGYAASVGVSGHHVAAMRAHLLTPTP